MSDLDDVLELMHTSSEGWLSLRMAGFEWRHLETLRRAWERHVSELPGSSAVSVQAFRPDNTGGSSRPAEESRERWRMWLTKPDKRRAQFLVGDDVVTAVFIGGTWWSSSRRGFMTNNGAPNHSHGFGPGEALLDPSSHLASLDIRVKGRITFLARPAFVVSAVPRTREGNGFDGTFHVLGTGADEYEVVVDAMVGVLLRCQANFGGEAFRVIEADELAVNEEFDDLIFDPDLLRASATDR